MTPVFNVERYLPAFIESVERQKVAAGALEVIAVDDGSSDGSLDLLQRWAGESRHRVHVSTKVNGGQATARNLGLARARGEWISFPDPDDLLDRNHLAAAGAFARANPEIELLSPRPVLLEEGRGRLNLSHPRRWQYDGGSRVADLIREPNVFLGVSSPSFYRLDRVRELGLEFDARIRPNFEDAHFAVRYLLSLDRPRIGLLSDAVYVYRKRAAGDSTLQRSMSQRGRYEAVFEHGYLDVIRRGRAAAGEVPPWIQQLLIYELSWYLSEDERIATKAHVPANLEARFHELLAEVLRSLDPAVVRDRTARWMRPLWLDLLAHAGRKAPWHGSYLVRSRLDRAMGLRRFHYRFTGAQPSETFVAAGEPLAVAFAKTMAHRYFNRDLLFERILWVPERPGGTLEVRLDGVGVPIEPGWVQGPGRTSVRPRRLADRLRLLRRNPRRVLEAAVRRRARPIRRRARRLATWPYRFLARHRPFSTRFADAWVLMDRVHDADDNGERLFEHLRAMRPDINAWFVLERDTPDWQRIASTGEPRLVAHGSFTWLMLMLNCRWLLSSHIDLAIARPPRVMRIRRRARWRLGFLQHGVIKDDLSRWLNHRDLDLFVVSTKAELASVAGDGTAYRFSTKETRNTGLPRFDRLLAKAAALPAADRDLVLVAPTWRQWLSLPPAAGSQRRAVGSEFWTSEYITSWTAVLRSPAIAAALEARGWRLGFMPHPNLQGVLRELDLPSHVEPLAFVGTDVQELYARTALLVTDYSSVAFNTAYLDRPVVYFQFDRDQMLGGAHVGRGGYFQYERDGFGPVVEDVAAAIREIVAAIERGPHPAPDFQARIDATFPDRDGEACARVVAAIEELSRPYARPVSVDETGSART